MEFYWKALIFICLEIALWYVFGTVTLRVMKQREPGELHKVLAGYITSNLLFSILAMGFKVIQTPLSWLSVCWSICVCLTGLAFLVLWFREKPYRSWRGKKPGLPEAASVLLLAVLIGITVWMTWRNGTVGSIWDDSYYVGDVSVSVYTNSISTYSPYTGEKLKELNTEYFFETLENHCAVISQIFGIHPILVVKYIQAGIAGVMYYLLLYAAGMVMCGKNRWKACVFPLVGGLTLLYGFGWLTQSGFYFERGGEGKTLQALVLIPFLFYQLIRIAYKEEGRQEWQLLFLLLCISFGLNMSSLFLLPVLLGAGVVSLAFVKKSGRVICNGLLCLIPFLVVGVIYLFMSGNLFSIPVR